ncbi:hypothetical protein SAMN05192563_1004193 [Paraburkholderia aspalathi]|uniref:Uncharacterized protein n=1 Tax=Paraburkholderia aspalathi TaxID=1324617 RepID=A0A1I7B5F9_9BURK|nr:hypothetical protein SAMN05192563_1004193 [Paraburkholderia aspalathi]
MRSRTVQRTGVCGPLLRRQGFEEFGGPISILVRCTAPSKSFMLSNDPYFVEKVRDIIGCI